MEQKLDIPTFSNFSSREGPDCCCLHQCRAGPSARETSSDSGAAESQLTDLLAREQQLSQILRKRAKVALDSLQENWDALLRDPIPCTYG
jgi:hypothetical protein